MTWSVPPRRALLLAAALLSGCAAAGTPSPGLQGIARAESVFGTYLSGRFAQSETDTEAAADRLLEALRRDPDEPEVLNRAFAAALLDGRAEAQRLARRLPQNQAAALLLVGSEALAGRWAQAEQRVRALPRQGPAQLLQPLLLAWVQQGLGQTDAALATLRPLAEAGRLRGLHALHMALIADLAGRPREAERAMRTALAETPEPTLRLLQLATAVLARSGRDAEAMRLVDGLSRGLSDYALAAGTEAARRALLEARSVASPVEGIAEAYHALAAALRPQGANDAALILARLALRLRPDFGPTLLLIAENYAEERHPESALRVLGQVPPGDALAPVVALRRAALFDRMDRVPEAEQALRGLAEALPAAPQPLVRLGDLFRARSRFPEAVTAYDQAAARIPEARSSDWPLFYARGIANERAGNWPRAEADFQRALELAPEQPYVMNYLAYTWVEQGRDLPAARRMLERAVELRPNDGNIVDSLGWALFRMGDIPGAIRWLERAVELEPRNSVINDHLGDAYWRAGRQQEARFQWSRALGLEPEPDDLAKITAKLRDGLPESPAATAQRTD
ncbi:tetratricopeptide repeat protein [Falsiroseomonas selenitidurans]|uniref:Tetratricopeptide repeat protein n=1 Tax=Falsiroseomonas selenitidurans TaxID=2716335 RepID=A0ABX1E7R2_9PROT|nr:tetratricopeptide repeat protein [Falsiroseomonas selenitidurans]NKC33003.1 tetratricopeptide repeat protein [Falsiroseomonas selenitidurans]